MKKLLLTALIIGLAVVGATAFRNRSRDVADFVTKRLEKGAIVETVTATGTITPISNIDVGTQVSGRIQEIFVDYNSQVQKGQLLALIDPSSFESNVAKEKANLEVAKAQVLVAKASRDYYKKHLERITKLNKQSYSADKELDEAQKDYDTSVAQMALYQAQVEQAQAALDYNLIQLGYTKIISPVDGMIVSKNIEAGQTVAASFETPTLFNVAEDLTKMKIEASVVEADIAKVKEGQTVEFSVDSYPDEIFTGTVTQVRNEAVTNSNVVTYEVIIEVDNSDLKFKPGMTANVEIITASKNDILVSPNKALRFSIDNGETRYKDKGLWILDNGQPRRLAVMTGIYDDDSTEVSGPDLQEGMEVIVERSETAKKPAVRMRMPR